MFLTVRFFYFFRNQSFSSATSPDLPATPPAAFEDMDEDGKHVYGAGPLYTTRIDGEVPLFIPPGATGASALPPVTLCECFHATAEKYPSRDAVAWRVKDDAPSDAHPYSFYSGLATTAVGSHWDKMTWAQLEQECYIFANACLKMGVESKDACVVMGFNTPQWLIAFHGSVQAGGVIVGSYPTNGIETCEYLGQDCGAKLVLTESWAHGSKFETLLRDKSQKLAKIVVWGDMTAVPSDIASSKEVLSFVDFMAEGRVTVGATHGHSHIRQTVKAEEAKLKPTQCCCLIYTSGTTGPPKVMTPVDSSSHSSSSNNNSGDNTHHDHKNDDTERG